MYNKIHSQINGNKKLKILYCFNNQLIDLPKLTNSYHLSCFENKLKNLQLKVKQTQASTQEQQVVATLELM